MSFWEWFLIAASMAGFAYGRAVRLRAQALETRLQEVAAQVEDWRKKGREQERRFRELLERLHEAVVYLNDQGRVVAVNRAAKALFQLPPDQAFPLPPAVLHRDPEWQASLTNALLALHETVVLPEIRTRDKVLAAELSPIEEGGALLICTDITHQTHREERSRRLISNLMHDLKTSLTSILGYARTIETLGDKEHLRKEAAGVIVREARKVNAMLDSMLALERLQQDRSVVEGRSNLVDLWASLRRTFAPLAEARGVNLEASIPRGKDLALAFSEAERILRNVLDNALRFAPTGSTIHVRAELKGPRWFIAVEDEGPGIPDHQIPFVTERFFMADRSRTKGGGGHGLGLAIVKETLDTIGGKIRIANRPSGGLAVTLEIPCHEA